MFRGFFIAMLVFWVPTMASAGELVSLERAPEDFQGYTTSYPCSHVFAGKIEPGDAGKIEVSQSLQKLCLDSRGGDLDEALKIIRYLREYSLGTRIREGERCEGACAWVFMAGSGRVEEGLMVPDRTMHPLAYLAFTRPASNGAEPETAYATAQAQIAVLVRELFVSVHHADPRPAKPSLLAGVLELSLGERLAIDTVDRAGRFGIVVSPVKTEIRPGEQAFIRACDNAANWAVGASAIPAYEEKWVDLYKESRPYPNLLELEIYLAPEFGPGCTVRARLSDDGLIENTNVEATHASRMNYNAIVYLHPETKAGGTGRPVTGCCVFYRSSLAIDSMPCW